MKRVVVLVLALLASALAATVLVRNVLANPYPYVPAPGRPRVGVDLPKPATTNIVDPKNATSN